MDITAGPAALGGLILSVALCGWALGRWQAGTFGEDALGMAGLRARYDGAAELRHDPAIIEVGVEPMHQAGVDRPNFSNGELSLSELHQEVAAIRRAERIFTTFSNDALIARSDLVGAARPIPRPFGQSSYPPAAASPACDRTERGACHRDGLARAAFVAVHSAQPSAEVSADTRV